VTFGPYVTTARPKPAPSAVRSAVPPPRRSRKPLVGAIIGTIASAGVAVIVIPAVGLKIAPSGHNPAAFTSPTSQFRTSEPASPPPQGKNPFASLPSYPPSVTAAVYDATTGRTYVLHPGVAEYTASIVDVEIMGTLLKQAQSQGGTLPGAELALMTSMIEASDSNSATQLLADAGGPSNVKKFDEMVGMTSTEPHATTPYIDNDPSLPAWGLTTTTAADEVKLIRAFAYPNSVLNDTNRNYGIGLMTHVEADQDWGVAGGVAPGTTLALKNRLIAGML
jgi:hypothetical protein